MPEQRRPVVRPRRERIFLNQRISDVRLTLTGPAPSDPPSPTEPGPSRIVPGDPFLRKDINTAKSRPCRRIIALRRTTHRRKRRLIKVFRRRNRSADRLGKRQQLQRLFWPPHTVPVPHTRTNRERRNNLRVSRTRKLHHILPFFARQHASKTRWRSLRRWRIGIVKIGRVRPSAAHPHIRWPQRRPQFAQARICQINRWTLPKG